MKISLKLDASQTTKTKTFDISDLGFTELEWSQLSESEKNDALESFVNDLEQPSWIIESFNELT